MFQWQVRFTVVGVWIIYETKWNDTIMRGFFVVSPHLCVFLVCLFVVVVVVFLGGGFLLFFVILIFLFDRKRLEVLPGWHLKNWKWLRFYTITEMQYTDNVHIQHSVHMQRKKGCTLTPIGNVLFFCKTKTTTWKTLKCSVEGRGNAEFGDNSLDVTLTHYTYLIRC